MGRKLVIGWAFRSIKDNGCPLFAIEPTVNNVGDLLAIVKRVTQNQVVETSCWFESGQGHQSCICSVRDSKPDVARYAYFSLHRRHHAKRGKIRRAVLRELLAPSSWIKRLALTYAVPYTTRAGRIPDCIASPATWCGLTLHDAEMKRIMSERDMRERISAIIPIPNDTPSIDEMRSYIQSEHVKWGALVKQLGLAGSQ